PALSWLALAPAWPERLARRGFPGESGLLEGEDASNLLRKLEKQGRIRSGPGEPPLDGTWFWCDSRQRATACDDILKSPQHAFGVLWSQLSAAAAAMKQAAAQEPFVNTSFERWIELAGAGTDETMARVVDDQVASALEVAVKADATSSPAAVRWMEIAQP